VLGVFGWLGTCLEVGDNSWKRLLIPHNVYGPKGASALAFRLAQVGLASW